MGLLDRFSALLRRRQFSDWERKAHALARDAAIQKFLPGFPFLSFYLANLGRQSLREFADLLGRTMDAEIETATPVRQMIAETADQIEGMPPTSVLQDFARMSHSELEVMSDVMQHLDKLPDLDS